MFTCLLLTEGEGRQSVEEVRRKWRTFIPREGVSDSLVELLLDADFCARAGDIQSGTDELWGLG